jgi:hypothetical protein
MPTKSTIATGSFIWTIALLIVSIFTMMLWIRSYFLTETIFISYDTENAIAIRSGQGKVLIARVEFAGPSFIDYDSKVVEEDSDVVVDRQKQSLRDRYGFEVNQLLFARWSIAVPLWFILITSCMAAAIPWTRWTRRFRLSTLLIVMTIASCILGAVAAFKN